MLRCLTYYLMPTPAQIARLNHFLYVGRKLYNHSLEQRIRFYKSTGKSLSNYDQTADLTQLRAVSQVLADVPALIEREALRRLDKAFAAFFRRVKERDGKPAGFPRFKSANRWNSFAIANPGNIIVLGNRIRVSGVDGSIKARNVRLPEGKVKQLRIAHRAGKWYAKLTVDDQQQPPAKVPVIASVGIDVGLNSFATLSTGEHVPNPRFGRKMASKLRRAHQRLSRCKKGSRNRRKAITRLQRVYAKIADQRWNFTHHLSKRLVNEFQLIAVEKLNIAGMVRNRRLSKSILDAAWGQLLFQLHAKAENAGHEVIEVHAPGTSQDCSDCGDKVLKDLSVRVHNCPSCGIVMDRDENAARNILARAKSTGGRPETNGSGVATGRRRKSKSSTQH
jgi:putative transposase